MEPEDLKKAASRMAKKAIELFDTNKDGKLVPDEAKPLLKQCWEVGMRHYQINDKIKELVKIGDIKTTT